MYSASPVGGARQSDSQDAVSPEDGMLKHTPSALTEAAFLPVYVKNNNYYEIRMLKYISCENNKSYKVKLEEWGANPLPSDYETDSLTT